MEIALQGSRSRARDTFYALRETASVFRDEFIGLRRDIEMARYSIKNWITDNKVFIPVTRNPRIALANAILGGTAGGSLALVAGAAALESARGDYASLTMFFGAITVTCLGIAAFSINDRRMSRRNHEMRIQRNADFASFLSSSERQAQIANPDAC